MRRALIGLVLIAPLLSGCAVGYAKHSYVESYRPTSLADMGIPRGHVPPVGACRIWIPGVSPGHQGHVGACRRLHWHVPPGGWLLSRPARHVVELHIYDDHRSRVREILTFELRGGSAYDDGRYGY